MNQKLDWNYERYRTRDLLLEYDKAIMPPHPRAAGLNNIYSWGSTIPSDTDTLDFPIPHQKDVSIIYPWENLPISVLTRQLYTIAEKSGFSGTEKDFEESFGTFLQNKQIVYANYIDFPVIGELDKLYFDLEEKILYYWDQDYYPINALLIENTILDNGNAEE